MEKQVVRLNASGDRVWVDGWCYSNETLADFITELQVAHNKLKDQMKRPVILKSKADGHVVLVSNIIERNDVKLTGTCNELISREGASRVGLWPGYHHTFYFENWSVVNA